LGETTMAKENLNFNVEGMTCMHCVGSVKKAVSALNGVDKVEVNLENKKVNVEFDPERVSFETIKNTIEDQGYDVK
jgi:copper chaperone